MVLLWRCKPRAPTWNSQGIKRKRYLTPYPWPMYLLGRKEGEKIHVGLKAKEKVRAANETASSLIARFNKPRSWLVGPPLLFKIQTQPNCPETAICKTSSGRDEVGGCVIMTNLPTFRLVLWAATQREMMNLLGQTLNSPLSGPPLHRLGSQKAPISAVVDAVNALGHSSNAQVPGPLGAGMSEVGY